MTSAVDKESNAISSSGHQKKRTFAKNQNCDMPIIRCTCGAEILLIPDINEMNNAIINHIKEHKKTALTKGKEGISPNKIERILVAQTLRKASEKV